MADTGNLKVLADLRLKEAEELLRVRMWSGAYYLSGYAVELALKAAATKSFRPHHMPDKAFVTRLQVSVPTGASRPSGPKRPDIESG